MTCNRRLFLLGTATTFAGAFLAACGSEPNEEVAKTQVPVGSAVILDRFIIAQPTAGNFVAYSAVCPHQGSKITQVLDDGSVRCPNHGSVFDLETGAALAGPADKPLTTATLTEEGDTLTAAP